MIEENTILAGVSRPGFTEAAATADAPSGGVRIVMLFGLLWSVATLAAFSATGALDGPAHPLAAHANLDPNTAEWWELSSLPQIGSGLAKDIVAYREQATVDDGRPFRRAADLEQVPGIGPKTVQRLARYLRFDEQ